ncbi:MAG: NADH-quinone oxidoreductase subunit N [Planctomycetota bacterium]|nr:NADH-quinone oxidoreductase subunit N [Planctomycetota bacterium]
MNGVTPSDLALLLPELILIGAALVLLLTAHRTRTTSVGTTVTLLAAIAALWAAGRVSPDASASGFGGMLAADGYARYFRVLFCAGLAVVALLSERRIRETGIPRPEYHTLLLLASVGMMLAASSADLLPLYLALELITICAYVLVGIRVERPLANEAAIKYFLSGSFASALMLLGISLTYGLTGTTEFAGIASSLAADGDGASPLLICGLGLICGGLAFKVAAVPFHAWAPDTYQGASAPVAAFLAAGSKAAGLAALCRVVVAAFGPQAEVFSTMLAALAALSVVLGSLVAAAQTDMKRLLAYSSIAHAGFALMGIAAGTAEGAAATMTYAGFYVFMTLGAFGMVIALGERGERVDGYRGLAAQRPVAAAGMLLFLLSLTGIPLTAGFTAKFSVIQSAIHAGRTELAVLAVLSSVVAAFVYMRVAVGMYMKEPCEPEPARIAPTVCLALVFAALVTLAGGLFPGILDSWTVAP